MTENEAIKELETSIELAKMCTQNSERKREIEAYNMAIQALEEMQKIKALGDCYIIPKNSTWEVNGIDIHKALEEIQQYRAIGTVEEFKALKEKNEPYKPKTYEDKYYGCKCGEVLLEKWEEYPKKLMPKSWGLPYCLGCGQKLDWQ